MHFLSRVIFLLLPLFLAIPAWAQFQEGPTPVIEDIEIEYRDLQNVAREVIMAQIQIREGMPYDQNLVDRSIRSLYATGLFDFIEASVREAGPLLVDVVFVVQSKYRIQEIRYVGNDKYSNRRLEGKTDLKAGQVLDEQAVAKAAFEIREYYTDKGFTNVQVDYELTRNRETGLGIVTFKIIEGRRLKIDRIAFEGNQKFSDRRLRRAIETKTYKWWISWLTGSGRFDENQFAEDLLKLRDFYRDAGYLDVEISEDNVVVEERGSDIVLLIHVNEGRQYLVGDIQVEGEEIINELIITRSLQMIPGDVFSPSALDKDIERVQDIYGSLGYLDTSVRVERIANLETGDIDMVYRIQEGEQFHVEAVEIEGNTKTKSVVLLRELALRPGQVFNTVWMKNSEARLRNTRFFEEVTLRPEPTNIPQRRNLKVSVREGRTGQFQFGAGFSSLENAVFFFELTQGNFDVFNHRSFFQGDGQKFRFRASIGSRSNEIILAFEEPWFFEQRVAVGFELYRREADYNSSIYDETRAGIDLYLRKRLFELVEGRLSYTFEVVDIDLNVPANSTAYAREILNEGGKRNVSKAGVVLIRDTRNDLIFTTRGSRFSLITEFAGLGGDTEYLRLESRNAMFLPTFESGDQVLALLFRAGTIWPYAYDGNPNENDVPFFDRYFLGGPYSLRGFEYREVGPRGRNVEGTVVRDPVGGNSYGFASVEYTIKVAEPMRLAMFYDWGFVNSDEFDFGPGGYNDNWGIGIRLLVLGNPLSLDYGIPITSSKFGPEGLIDNDDGGQFNFSFGTRF